jgi:hypothetical protein
MAEMAPNDGGSGSIDDGAAVVTMMPSLAIMMVAMAIMMVAVTGDKGGDCTVQWQQLDLNSNLRFS